MSLRNLFYTIVLLLSSAVFAAPAPIKVNVVALTSGRVNGVIKLQIWPEANGFWKALYDPNTCGNPGPCSELATSVVELQPEVISDSRNVDGSLKLKLGDIILIVGSRETLDGTAPISARVGNESIPLKADIDITVPKN